MTESRTLGPKNTGQMIGQFTGGAIGIALCAGLPHLNVALTFAIMLGCMFVGACLGRMVA